ncbi:CapA family protein [Amycolatopsis cynarae]|uniref:CapA family protein n=1 Tax=Amycolatopsis cynarae TaxID=2995223 RepID=A0ABY7B3A4_9PSEU|nr:CapA family protein [Amycolatopsis sp. HUAS 11-8]WAL66417.1 CapA family protein [Amycolatopsis sp. HUAS 11-8]
MTADAISLLLCGDVMLGRGVDQVLPHPGPPELWERSLDDARAYVMLAERANGLIPRPVGFAWPWGAALAALSRFAPDVRVLNLETSITADGEFAPGKGVHYRLNPANLRCLTAAGPDVCVLANNHVLDFGQRGLEDTLTALSEAGLRYAGAGRTRAEAEGPVVTARRDGRSAVVVAGASESSGVPPEWAAGPDRPGVAFVSERSGRAALPLAGRALAAKRPGDVTVVSLHWGSNWGYGVPAEQRRFAHRLIDAGVDVVYGHSSHHPRPIEVYRGKLILYGCGDLINDYEGIRGYEDYRDDLRLLYFASVATSTGELVALRMVPFQARRLRLEPASRDDVAWLRATLDRISRPYGPAVAEAPDGTLVLA